MWSGPTGTRAAIAIAGDDGTGTEVKVRPLFLGTIGIVEDHAGDVPGIAGGLLPVPDQLSRGQVECQQRIAAVVGGR